MTTVVDALQNASDAMNNAVQNVLGIRDQLAQQASAAVNQTTTIINNFIGRPPVVVVYCDPLGGDDTADGTTPDKAKKSLDLILDNIGTSATSVLLMNDTVIRRRRFVYAPLTITGVQKSTAAAGYILQQRTVAFLGTAENSPDVFGGTYCSGMNISGPNFTAKRITFALADQPGGQTYSSHLFTDLGSTFFFDGVTLTVSSGAAGALIGSVTNKIEAYLAVALGTGAAGHLFAGVAAGGNPNNVYQYHTNVTSA